MTQEHPITPPPDELVEQWREDNLTPENLANYVAAQAARWGADQELEACCAIAVCNPVCGTKHQRSMLARHIRELRRPKPPSLKQQALATLEEEPDDGKELLVFDTAQVNIIRRALEALPE